MRVILVNPRSGEGLDWQAPFKTVSRSRALSAPASVSVTLPAVYNQNVDEQGHPWVLEFGTIVAVEESNGELVSGLVDSAPLHEDLSVDAGGLSMLAKDTPWDADPVSWIGKDALAAWREIWEHVIARSGVKNFRLTGDTRCGVTVGKGPSAEYDRVQADIARLQPEVDRADRSIRVHTRNQNAAAQRMYRAAGNRKVIGEISTATEAPGGSPGGYNDAVITYDNDDPFTALAAWFYRTSDFSWVRYGDTATVAAASDWLWQAEQLRRWEAIRKPNADTISNLESWLSEHEPEGEPEPYELNAWSTRDLAATLDELREIGGFDYVEHTRWVGDELEFIIEVRNQIGIPKPDLRFELGVNVHAQPELVRGDVRTEVHAHGAGEGQSTLMADRVLDHPRLVRSVVSVDDKDWNTQQQVRKGADKALTDAKKALDYTLNGLVVHDHDAAPLSSFSIGDTITVRGRHSDGVRREFTVRIQDIARDGDEDKVSLEVTPA
jgi:hypothetical protein